MQEGVNEFKVGDHALILSMPSEGLRHVGAVVRVVHHGGVGIDKDAVAVETADGEMLLVSKTQLRRLDP